ncbi:hypothetical protein RI367_003777 [Sorochytrium milnesiophthora]
MAAAHKDHATARRVSDHDHHRQDSDWRSLLFSPATVVTLEKKYATHNKIAEFWCTVTSPFFALPTLLLCLYPSSAIPPATRIAIVWSVLAAVCSTAYHASLYKIFSTMDACVAVAAFYANTIAVMAVVPGAHGLWGHPYTGTCVLAGIVLVFIWRWRSTAVLASALMAALLPVCTSGYVDVEEYVALALGFVGIACFLLDRRGICCAHPWWHIFGGLSLLFGLHETIVIAEHMHST